MKTSGQPTMPTSLLVFYNHLGRLINRYRRWLIPLLTLCGGGFVALLLMSGDGRYDRYAMGLAVVGLWLLGALALGSYFPVDPKAFTPADDSRASRWGTRLRRLLCWAVMVTASGAGVLLLSTSVKLLGAD